MSPVEMGVTKLCRGVCNAWIDRVTKTTTTNAGMYPSATGKSMCGLEPIPTRGIIRAADGIRRWAYRDSRIVDIMTPLPNPGVSPAQPEKYGDYRDIFGYIYPLQVYF